MFRFDKDLWTAVSPLFDRALDLDSAGRAALLADAAGAHPQLAQVLARLLEDHERLLGSDFLESSPAFETSSSPSLAGQTVGPYQLDVPLGMGGMGSVWRAQRIDGRFEGFVAIKLLNLALVGPAGDQRFKREGTLLARLTHPHIARLLDAGVTSTGQPYLVLEHVEGTRIDQFADERRLSTAERLNLFLQVADAVAHAHASLVVHRDLKPSNILVAEDGQVKLLDFGIGKLLAAESERHVTDLTQAPQALTPEYAAPEQARAEAITTATDVYALGVLLYVLLTGRHPTGARCRTPAEHVQALLENDAVRASDAVTAATREEAVACAALRQSTPERLRRLYRGDIDNVLAKALEKVPDDRYASVTALADEIHRFLHHEPLRVQGHAWGYRAVKFVRRHRWPVAAAVLTFALLSAGLFVANRQRLIAENRFRQLRHLSQQVFELDTRISRLAGATDARQALVATSLEYLEGLAADAHGDLDLMQEMSDNYWRVARIQGVPVGISLGDFVKAEVSLKKADALLDTILAARPRDRRALERAAMIAHDRMIVAESEHRDADALAHARKAVERTETLLADAEITSSQRETTLAVYNNVAVASVNMHLYDDGIRYARRVIEIARSHDVAPRWVSFSLSVVANALRLQGDVEGALKAIREAHEIVDKLPLSDQTLFDRYAILLREAFILGEDRGINLDRPAEAVALLREAVEMHEAAARRDPNDTTSRTRAATSGRELGDILRWRAPQDAVAVYDVALGRLDEIKGNVKARRDKALVLASSSYALRRLNRAAEARRRVDEALVILRETKDYPADQIRLDGELYSVLQALADHHADEGRLKEAIQHYDQLLKGVMAARPDVENDLRDANNLSLLYEDFARLHRLIGATENAKAIETERTELWSRWNRKLPNNPFVLRQLAHRSPPD